MIVFDVAWLLNADGKFQEFESAERTEMVNKLRLISFEQSPWIEVKTPKIIKKG